MLFSSLILLAPILFTSASTNHFDRNSDSFIFRSNGNITYPASDEVGPQPLPHWISLYEQVKAEGKIPGFAPSVLVNGNPKYPDDVDTSSSGICAWSITTCVAETDLSEAPDGKWAISFDDGPLEPSIELYSFLKSHNQKATHFMIGSNIQDYPSVFQQAVDNGDHIAAHSWSHHYCTTLTDMQLLGEIGFTSQIIYDRSGLMPIFWRPPFGDVDNRVRAIAEHVFGLTTVLWNTDSNDWCLDNSGASTCVGYGPVNQEGIVDEMNSWMAGSRSPGVISLQHELTSFSVGAFIQAFPSLVAKGWITETIPDLFGLPWYKSSVLTVQAISNSTISSTNSSSTTTTAPTFITSIKSSTTISSTSSSASSSSASTTGTSSTSTSTKVTSGAIKTRSSVTVVEIVLIAGFITFAL